jgi:hypothetical protein
MADLVRAKSGWAAVLRISALVALTSFAATARAQSPAGGRSMAAAQSTLGTLAGRVTDPRHAPIAGAVVELRREAGGEAALRVLTRADGSYTLRLPGGGEYVVTAARTGFVSATLLLSNPAGAGTLTQDIRLAPLTPDAVALPGIVARAARRVPTPPAQQRTPGEIVSTTFAFSSELFPVDGGDLLGFAALVPGVLPSGGEAGRGVSIGGQPASQNRVTLDGAGYGSGSVPAEAVAASGVITHPYDVSRGQFTGGVIAGATRSGTNLWGGSASLALLDPRLQFDGGANGVGGKFSSQQLSAGGGGPLVPGRLFVYGAGQLNLRDGSARSADALLAGSGVARDSLERLSAILEGLGIETRRPESALGNDFATGIARFDYLPGTRHAFMLRLDGRHLRTTGIGASPLAFAPGSQIRDDGGGALFQVTSTFGAVQHQFRAYGSAGAAEASSASDGPAGVVRVGADGAPGVAFRFGGSPLAETSSARSAVEVEDRVVATLGDAHQVQLGATYSAERIASTGTANRYGTFTFASLDALAAGRATSFTRSLSDTRQEAATGNAALFAGDTWQVSDAFSIVMGVRGERRWYPGRHAGNPAADSLFGLRTGRIAPEWGVSPRVGFRYRRSPFFSIHGGAGEFRGAPPLQPLAALLGQTGRNGAGEQLACIGSAAPAASWGSYLVDPSTIPQACAEGGDFLSSRGPSVAAFSTGYSAPRIRRASLDVTGGTRTLYFTADASMAWGADGAVAGDANLRPAPSFHLPDEGGRPVYVAGETIDPGSGSVTFQDSRRVPGYGIVRQVTARGRTRTRQLVLDGTWQFGRGYVAASYAYTRSEDQASGFSAPGAGLASTAGDPRRVEWGPRDFEQRHAATLRVSRYPSRMLQFTLVGHLLSGAPFSPMVEGDISGDGLANDRAFVFDPASAPELAPGMAELLGRVPGSLRTCLRAQMGTVAARNSCRTPWTASLDAQLNISPLGRRDRRLAFTVTAQNLDGGLDYLLHGGEDLRGWGPGRFDYPDPVLLRVRGFDPAARRFRYEVNPGFGSPAGETGRARVPFTIRIQGRVAVGADPAAQLLTRAVVAMDASTRPAELRKHFAQHLPNAPARVLQAADSLRLALSANQTSALRLAADSLALRIEAATAALADALSRPRSATRRDRNIDELLTEARALVQSGVTSTCSILTPSQWSRLPAKTVRVPRRIPRPTVNIPAPF